MENPNNAIEILVTPPNKEQLSRYSDQSVNKSGKSAKSIQLSVPSTPNVKKSTTSIASRHPALDPLDTIQILKIHQVLDTEECREGEKFGSKYAISALDNRQYFYAEEATNPFIRQLYRTHRAFKMKITDAWGLPIMSLVRGVECFPFSHGPAEVKLEGSKFATIHRRYKFLRPIYELRNKANDVMFTIEGPHFCQLTPIVKYFSDITFQVNDYEGIETAVIVKQFGGFKEAYTGTNDFTITFTNTELLKSVDKAMILAGAFLIDIMYYEHKFNIIV